VSLLLAHWTFDPFLILVLAIAALHATGLHRLNRRSRPDRAASRRRRAGWFYLGLAVLIVAVMSPIDYWASRYFWVHMIQHLLLMFGAPVPIVAGAPWLPLTFGLPVRLRRYLGRGFLLAAWSAPIRMVGRTLLRPWVAVGLFNVVMVLWHVPGPFDLAERNQAVHIWLMHGSFFAAGVLFWLQFIESRPLRVRLSPVAQLGALFLTNGVMWFLAMALGLFATGSWYVVYDHVPGVTLPPLADQQLGAAILWVCGDFWCLPAVIAAVRRLQEQEDGFDGLLERIVRRPAVPSRDGL
jgi:cytochrome c oxidase assembly factor CtaG